MEYVCYLCLCLHIFLTENEKIILTIIGKSICIYSVKLLPNLEVVPQGLFFGSAQIHEHAASLVLNKSL